MAIDIETIGGAMLKKISNNVKMMFVTIQNEKKALNLLVDNAAPKNAPIANPKKNSVRIRNLSLLEI
jgi:hypothetical protein